MKTVIKISKFIMWIIPVVVSSVYGLIFGNRNGRIQNVKMSFHSLVNILI